jgi:nucleoside-diphosphate-sugar epimerase
VADGVAVQDPHAAPAAFAFELGSEIAPEVLSGVDALVHCAWDFGVSSPGDIHRVNVKGSLRLLEAAKAARVGRQVFISTMSAFPGCRSLYGKAKLEVELSALESGVAVVRPGLVYGSHPGGMVGALRKVVAMPVVPLVGMGNQMLYLVHEDDLSLLVGRLCAGTITAGRKPILAANSQGWTFREILRLLAEARGKHPLFVPVPWQCEWLVLRMLEAVGLRPRLRSDGLIGLVNQEASPDFGETSRLHLSFRPFGPESSASGADG